MVNTSLLSFFSRTVYYTSYRQVYTMETQTVFRCCPGWSQQPGDRGCLSRECPHAVLPVTLQTLYRPLAEAVSKGPGSSGCGGMQALRFLARATAPSSMSNVQGLSFSHSVATGC